MKRINEQYSVSIKNGYFLYHEIKKAGKDAKNAGEEMIKATKTYHKLLDCYSALKALGVDGDKVMQAFDQLLNERSQAVGKAYLKAKQQ